MTKTEELKVNNCNTVRQCFYCGNVWTRNELAEKTGLSLATTTNIIADLTKEKMIEKVGLARSTGGRKSNQYRINKNYKHIGAMVLQAQEILTIYSYSYNLANEVVWHQTHRRSHLELKTIIHRIEELLKADPKISLLCISIPGVCQDGIIGECDIECLRDIDLHTIIKKEIGIESVIENDVNVACIGFSYQHPKASHIAFILQPKVNYVGCGLMIHGHLYNGFSHFAGELKYLPIHDKDELKQLKETDPVALMKEQMMGVCAVMDPQVIGYYSECFTNESIVLDAIPDRHRPVTQEVKEIDSLIENGLYYIGMKNIQKQ